MLSFPSAMGLAMFQMDISPPAWILESRRQATKASLVKNIASLSKPLSYLGHLLLCHKLIYPD